MSVRVFLPAAVTTVLALGFALLYRGPQAVVLTAILGVLEVSLSFDNAVVNASVLQRMTPLWQRMFLSVGVLVAVFGTRLLFPLLIVAISAHVGPVTALDLALHPPDGGAAHFPDGRPSYATLLQDANPKIAAFGGVFLLLLFLNFISTEHDITWLAWPERVAERLGRLMMFPVIVTLIVLTLTAGVIAPDDKAAVVMVAGALGMITYFVVDGLGMHFASERSSMGPANTTVIVGRAAFFGFWYLEVVDASFSFDSVLGSFAVTTDPVIIALGLGAIGAVFVRSITVFMVRQRILSQYVYLEHGAHWAIGALALVLLYSTGHHVSEVVTGLAGVAIIALAIASSMRRRRRQRHQPPGDPTEHLLPAEFTVPVTVYAPAASFPAGSSPDRHVVDRPRSR